MSYVSENTSQTDIYVKLLFFPTCLYILIKKEICGFKWVSKGSPSLSQHNYVDAFLGILPGRILILWIGLSKNELEKSHLRIPPNWYAYES